MDLKLFFALLLAAISIVVGPKNKADQRSLLAVLIDRVQNFARDVVKLIEHGPWTFLRLVTICKKIDRETLTESQAKACEYLTVHKCALGLEMTRQCRELGTWEGIEHWLEAVLDSARRLESLRPGMGYMDTVDVWVPLKLPVQQELLESGGHTIEFVRVMPTVFIDFAVTESEGQLLEQIKTLGDRYEVETNTQMELERATAVDDDLETAFHNLGIKPETRNVALGFRNRELGKGSGSRSSRKRS